MKKCLLIILFAVTFKTFGQLDYTFAKSASSYVELSSPNVISTAWPQTFGMKLPFQFSYFKKPFDSLRITPNSVAFTKSLSDFVSMGQEDYYFGGVLYPVGSEISYLITGTSPNRIVKAQYKNLRAVTTDTSYDYHVNNQIWLYETSNVIEFHVGPNYNDDINITTFYFGFRDADGSPYLALSGTVANPTFAQVMNVGTFKGLSSHPPSGTVYTFTPYKATVIAAVVKPYTFLNNGESMSFVAADASSIIITDLSGKHIYDVRAEANEKIKYDYNALSSGMYLVTVNTNNQLYTEKIIVQ